MPSLITPRRLDPRVEDLLDAIRAVSVNPEDMAAVDTLRTELEGLYTSLDLLAQRSLDHHS